MNARLAQSLAFYAAIALAPALAGAQQPPAPVTPQLDFSGVIFGSYGYRTDSAAKAGLGGSNPNQFGLDRAYLTFRMPAGDNGAIRVTTDVFQNSNAAQNAFYQGWAIRIKYAYAQYTGLRNAFGTGSSLLGRIGVLHTVIIDHQEQYWPRYLGQVAVERDGFFSSADAGVAGLATLGNTWGEIYGTITNGPGYTSFERDRFKDVAIRGSFTPLAGHDSLSPILRSFVITPWVYKGWLASGFASAAVNPVGDGLRRDRWGIFAAVKERRITAGAELAQRMDESETGLNTAASPRVVADSTGRVLSAFLIGRPAEWFDPARHSSFSIVGRYDHFTPNTAPSAANYLGNTPAYNYWVLGASYDATSRLTFTLDWQVQSPTDFPPQTGTNFRIAPRTSTVFVHWQATF